MIIDIEFEELTHQNFSDACNIDRDDIPENFVDTASTIMNITDYGLNHHCMGHAFVVKYRETMYANSEDFQVLAITTMVSSFVAE